MVLKKSIYYGRFDGFQAPVVPKAPRSLRRNSHTKSSESSKICAFELLADVAGKLLQESESSTSNPDQERKEQINVLKEFVILEPTNLELKLEPPLKELPHSDHDSCLEHVSTITTSDFLKKVDTNVKFEASEGKNVDNPSKPEGYPHGDLCDFNLVNDITEIQTEVVEKQRGELTFREPVEACVNTRVLNKSYSSVHLSVHRGNVKTGIRDDDEKSFRCNHRVTKMMAFRSQSRAGDRKIRKMLTSRDWKVALKKEYELIETTSGGAKPLYQNRKNIYTRERCQTEAASKRRRLFHHSSKDAYVQKESSESVCKSHETGVVEDKRRPHVASNKAGVTSSVISHKGSFHCTDSHVKFSIKSFKVPELYLEVPETATVGSLKRTVMEAVTAILGGKLHVGILIEGKKVGDNNITLEQTGISQNCNLETLGFTLEPSFPHDSPSRDNNQQLSRSDMGLSTSLENHIDNNQEIVPFQTEISEALVAVSHKPNKKCEFSQRRIRRPFSVSEVEALVEAVETLGTGRWRDVKLRAFDDANHRTYVDLKDKWKTLVHTASISPQQRRGEPVPQDLLDRVTRALVAKSI